MAIRGLSAAEKNWYVCRDDPDKRDTLEDSREAGATIFHFSSIPSGLMAELNDATQVAEVRADMSSQTMHMRGSKKNYDAFRFGITGWENYFDEAGEPIPFEIGQEMRGIDFIRVVPKDYMDRVRLGTVNEVGAYVFNKNSLQDTDRKKLEGLLSQYDGSDISNAPNAGNDSEESEDASGQPSMTDEKPILPGLPTQKQGKSTGPKSGTGKTRKPAGGKTPAPVA